MGPTYAKTPFRQGRNTAEASPRGVEEYFSEPRELARIPHTYPVHRLPSRRYNWRCRRGGLDSDVLQCREFGGVDQPLRLLRLGCLSRPVSQLRAGPQISPSVHERYFSITNSQLYLFPAPPRRPDCDQLSSDGGRLVLGRLSTFDLACFDRDPRDHSAGEYGGYHTLVIEPAERPPLPEASHGQVGN